MKIVTYEPAELWEVFQKDRDRLCSRTVAIAENPDFDVMIFLTAEIRGGLTLPTIMVWMEQREIYREECVSEFDLQSSAQTIYDEYLLDENLVRQYFDEPQEEDEELEQRQAIDDREDELYDAASDFLYVVTGGKLEKLVGYKGADDITLDFVNRTCEYLFSEHGISVFRPMMLEDENGKEFYEEYPYDCLTFDD